MEEIGIQLQLELLLMNARVVGEIQVLIIEREKLLP
jgi:hypothetical protein